MRMIRSLLRLSILLAPCKPGFNNSNDDDDDDNNNNKKNKIKNNKS